VHLEVPCAFSRHAWVALHTVFGSFVLFCFGCGSRGPTRVPAWVGERFSLMGGGGVLRNIGFAILSMDCNVRHKETLQWDPLGWASDESSANPASPSSPARPGSPASQPASQFIQAVHTMSSISSATPADPPIHSKIGQHRAQPTQFSSTNQATQSETTQFCPGTCFCTPCRGPKDKTLSQAG